MTSTATTAHAFKAAFVTGIKALFASDDQVLVSFGHPGGEALAKYDDAIGFADLRVEQDAATLGTNRSREEVLTLTVWISSFKQGDDAREIEAAARAYALLAAVEHYARQTDTTIGGTVRECFLTAHQSNGETDERLLANGRTIEIEATFTAKARVTGP